MCDNLSKIVRDINAVVQMHIYVICSRSLFIFLCLRAQAQCRGILATHLLFSLVSMQPLQPEYVGMSLCNAIAMRLCLLWCVQRDSVH